MNVQKYKPTEELFSRAEGFIETATGVHFHPDQPEFSIEDIAHSLSNLCRFNGHCRDFYSVAEHSVLVADLIKQYGGTIEEQFEGLMHDACEAYVSDMPAPFKQYCPSLVTLEDQIEEGIREKWGLPDKKSPICKRCDLLAVYLEALDLMPSAGQCFTDPYGLKMEALGLVESFPIWAYEPGEAKSIFVARYASLVRQRDVSSTSAA